MASGYFHFFRQPRVIYRLDNPSKLSMIEMLIFQQEGMDMEDRFEQFTALITLINR